MSDNRDVARQILLEAGNTILKNRPGIHGSAENSFEMIADMWTVYLRHVYRTRSSQELRPMDVAEMMTMLKKARKVYGASSNVDNDVDDVGYAALAGMLRLPDPAKSEEQDNADSIVAAVSKELPPQKHTGIDDRGTAERGPPVINAYNLNGEPLDEEDVKNHPPGVQLFSSPEEAAAARAKIGAAG